MDSSITTLSQIKTESDCWRELSYFCWYPDQYDVVSQYKDGIDTQAFYFLKRNIAILQVNAEGKRILETLPRSTIKKSVHRLVAYGLLPNPRFGITKIAHSFTQPTIKTLRKINA